jgi:cobaltochelatase CobN
VHLLVTRAASLDDAEPAAVDLGQSPADAVALSFTDPDLAGLAAAWERAGPLRPSLRLANLRDLRHPMSVDLWLDAVAERTRVAVVRLLGGLDYWRYGLEQLGEVARRTGMALAAVPGDGRPDPRLAELSTVAAWELDLVDGWLREGGPANLGELVAWMGDRAGRLQGWCAPRPVPAAGRWEEAARPVLRQAQDEAACPSTPAIPAPAVPAPPAPAPAPQSGSSRRKSGSVTTADAASGADERRRPVMGPDVRQDDGTNGAAAPRNAAAPAGAAGAEAPPHALLVFYRSLLLASDTAPVAALRDALAARGMSVEPLFVRSLKDPDSAALVRAAVAARRPDVVLNLTAFSGSTGAGTCLDAADAPVLQVVLPGMGEETWAASPRGLGAADLAMQVVLPETDGRILTRAVSFKGPAAVSPELEFTPSVHLPKADRIAFVADLAAAWARLGRTPAPERRIALVLSDYPGRGGRAGYAVGLDAPASVAAILEDLRADGWAVDPPDPARLMRALTEGPPEAALTLDAYRDQLAAWPADAVARMDAAWGAAEADPAFRDGAFRFRVVRAGNALVALQPDRGLSRYRKAEYHDPDLPPRHAYAAFYAWARGQGIHAVLHLGTHGTLEWLPGKAVALSSACYPELVLGSLPVVYPYIVNNPGEAAPAKHRIGAVTVGHLTPPLARAGLSGAAAGLEGLIEEYGAAESLDRRRAAMLRGEILRVARETGLAAECGIDPGLDDVDAVAALDAWLCDLKDLAIRDGLHVFGRSPAGPARDGLADALRAAGQEAAVPRIDACGPAEVHALLAALSGRFVPPGPAGAPTRGRADVLPTGRNLTTVDPRAVPTPTAWTLGRRAADAVLERHLQDHGDWPRSLVIDAWASPAMRTGGDDLAQALALIGAAPTWDPGAARVTGVEAWPADVLGRPRVDVTLRISGLFRDVFPEQIRLYDLAVRTVADLDEPDDVNPLAAARRRGEDLARVFGAAPGGYGAGVAALALDGEWAAREDLGRAYLDANAFAYGIDGEGRAAPAAFRERVAAADALVHVQDDRERDLLDADGVADFAGGFAAAAAVLGASPALYHLDTADAAAGPKARRLEEELARVVRARAADPRWIEGQMRHGWRGAAELAQAVDALYAFAATLPDLRGDPFQLLFDAYLDDDRVRAFLEEANPEAARAIARRFDEAMARGLWKPRRNSVARHLAALAGAA